jgi:hypothetical protein
MKYKYKVKCPECYEAFVVNIDPSIYPDFYTASCANCEKKVTVTVKDEKEINFIKSELSGSKPSKPTITIDMLRKQSHKPIDTERNLKHELAHAHTHEHEHHDEHNHEHVAIVSPLHTHLSKDTDKSGQEKDTVHIVHPKYRTKQFGNGESASSKSEKTSTKPKSNTFLNDPNKRLKLAIILLVIVFILGLTNGINSMIQGTKEGIGSDIDKPDYVDIHGRVIEKQTGRPIANVQVTIQETSQSTQTDNDGQYFIPNVKSGEHDIKVQATGYVDIVKKVTIDPELMGIINFELDEGAGIINIDDSVQLKEPEEYEKINSFAVIIIIFASFSLVAIILAYKRMFFYLCGFSAFLSVLSFGLGIGSILGLIAFILIIFSSASFKKLKPEPSTNYNVME